MTLGTVTSVCLKTVERYIQSGGLVQISKTQGRSVTDVLGQMSSRWLIDHTVFWNWKLCPTELGLLFKGSV